MAMSEQRPALHAILAVLVPVLVFLLGLVLGGLRDTETETALAEERGRTQAQLVAIQATLQALQDSAATTKDVNGVERSVHDRLNALSLRMNGMEAEIRELVKRK